MWILMLEIWTVPKTDRKRRKKNIYKIDLT
jgi:hypothetical protein